jgi:hypothetical protein
VLARSGTFGTVTVLAREYPLPTEGVRELLRPDQLGRFYASISKLIINPDYGECWVWTKNLEQGEYGRFYLGKKKLPDGRSVSVKRAAHVVSYMHFVGPIPVGWIVDHLCNNKACVAPDHLEAITQLRNLQRAQLRRPWRRLNQYAPDYSKDADDWRKAL